MQKYLRQHVVEATPMTCGEWELATGHKWNEPDRPRTDPGYKCDYPDGYSGWCPKDAFEKVSRKIDGMTFGMAVELLKRGKRVARKGWNGKGMWLWLKPATTVKLEWCKDPMLRSVIEENGGEMPALGTVCMFTHDSSGRKAFLTGWLASQTDMLSEDWVEVI